MFSLILSFFRFLFFPNFNKNKRQGLWNASFGQIIASLGILETAGFTLDMLEKIRKRGGKEIAKKIVTLFEVSDHINDYEVKSNWYHFYKNYFGLDVDLSRVIIPTPKLGFTRCIIIVSGVTLNMVVKKMREIFDVYTYTNDLDEKLVKNDREVKDEPYAIWVKDNLEPDKEYLGMSANQAEKENISGETLLERLIQDLEYWDKTKKHLDYKNITLCISSRDFDGKVPYVRSVPGGDYQVKIDWCSPDSTNKYLGPREVSC